MDTSKSNRGTRGHHLPYLGLWGRISGFTEDLRPHQNEMYHLVTVSYTHLTLPTIYSV